MKINSINEFKKYLAETYSAQDARDTFEGVLSPITIQEIENSFKTQYGVVTENDSFMYYMQLMDQKGLIIDRIVYCPTGEYDKYEWWTANSTINENMHFPTWNAVAEWFNTKYEIKLPLIKKPD